jgi:hypothetical protein
VTTILGATTRPIVVSKFGTVTIAACTLAHPRSSTGAALAHTHCNQATKTSDLDRQQASWRTLETRARRIWMRHSALTSRRWEPGFSSHPTHRHHHEHVCAFINTSCHSCIKPSSPRLPRPSLLDVVGALFQHSSSRDDVWRIATCTCCSIAEPTASHFAVKVSANSRPVM